MPSSKIDVFQRHSYAVCYKASMIKWLTSQNKTKILHFISRRNARWLPSLNCGKKLHSLCSTRSFRNSNKIMVSFPFWPDAKPWLSPGMSLLCSVWGCGSSAVQLTVAPVPKLSERAGKSAFPYCIKCIKWLQRMILHYVIQAKLQGSRWPSDVISPPKSVGKSVILTSSENKFWWLQCRGFSKAGGY